MTLFLIMVMLFYVGALILQRRQVKSVILLSAKPAPTVGKKISPELLKIGRLQWSLPPGLSTTKLTLLTLMLMVLVYNLSGMFHFNVALGILLMIITEIGTLYLYNRRNLTKAAFESELPHLLGVFARTYETSNDLPRTILTLRQLARSIHTKKLLDEALTRIASGETAPVALAYIARKSKHPFFMFMVRAVSVQLQRGSQVSQFLEEAGVVLTTQQQSRKEIEQLLFQNKVSAILSAAIVPILLIGSLIISAQYRQILLTETSGKLILIGSIIWWSIGTALTYSYTRIRL